MTFDPFDPTETTSGAPARKVEAEHVSSALPFREVLYIAALAVVVLFAIHHLTKETDEFAKAKAAKEASLRMTPEDLIVQPASSGTK